jgi:hypothetical protein
VASPELFRFIAQTIPIDTTGFGTHDKIIASLVGLLGLSITALVYVIKNYGLSKTAAEQSSEANKAVNNVGPGEHRLYDLVMKVVEKQEEFDRKWGNLPSDMDDAVDLMTVVNELRSSIADLHTKLDAHLAQDRRS